MIIEKPTGTIRTAYDLDNEPYLIEITGTEAKRFTDIIKAEVEGRLAVLPCKVGDMVFRYSHVEQQMQTLKCEGFLYDGLRWKARCTDFVQSWVGNQKRHFYLSANSFGKTAFLTREEAEKALEKKDE